MLYSVGICRFLVFFDNFYKNHEKGANGAPKSAEEMMAQVKEKIAHSKEMDEAEKAKIMEEAKRKSSGK